VPTDLRLRSALLALVLVALSCGKSDASGPDPYLYKAPPAGAAPAGLTPEVWTGHLTADLMPYWMMPVAQGTPVGNFPTHRDMTGATAAAVSRKSRMMGRQTYGYAVAYLLTGDEAYLALAQAGTRWLLDHARDTVHGGWYPDLQPDGNPQGTAPRFAQDFSYTAMGPAALYFVTRDPEAEAAVLATRDLLFDPAKLWDVAGARVRDGLDATMTSERFLNGSGTSDLVSQLDPITAFLLLVQPVLSTAERRGQALEDLRVLAEAIRRRHHSGGFFWGTTGDGIGDYGGPHSDFGHSLKAFWALTQVDKRLPDRPFEKLLKAEANAAVTRAYDDRRGRWKKRPLSDTIDEYGSDWWSWAEADQLAATLALHDPAWIPAVATTAARWREEYVDTSRPAREVFPSITAGGDPAYPWPDGDTAKCNEWKSAFHSTEHALVLYLFSHWLAGTPAPLYFAFPASDVEAMAAVTTPYTFQGKVASVEDLGEIASDPAKRHKVRVSFTELR